MNVIYKITCNCSNAVYIGRTKDFKGRCKKHRQRLRHDYHENYYLQNAWNKYGESNFTFEIIEDVSSLPESEVKDRELWWILKYFQKGRYFCFNLTTCTNGGNTIHTPEDKVRFSKAIKQSYTPRLREIRRKHSLNIIEETKKRLEETKKTNKWKEAHAKGMKKLSQNEEWKKKAKESAKKRSKAVKTDKGEYFESISLAARQMKRSGSNIRACIYGKTKSCAGRVWSYVFP